MSKALFPSRRFRGVGFSREEVAELQASFERSDQIVQRDTVDHLRSLSSAGLRQYAADRLGRHVSSVPETAEPPTEASSPLSEEPGDEETDLEDSGTPEA